MDCLFCKISKKALSSEVVYEDKDFLAFKDIHPIAPVHILIIPKKHIATIEHIEAGDGALIGRIFSAAKKTAALQNIAKTGYRLIFNVGKNSGQTVDHLHLHLLGGKKLSWQ